MAFPVENPLRDREIVFRSLSGRANPPHWIPAQNRPSSAAFRDKDRRLSVNWQKYMRDPAETRKHNTQAVISLFVGDCRESGKEVDHTPIQEGEPFGPNQAHAEICDPEGRRLSDEEDAVARDALARRAILAWQVPA